MYGKNAYDLGARNLDIVCRVGLQSAFIYSNFLVEKKILSYSHSVRPRVQLLYLSAKLSFPDNPPPVYYLKAHKTQNNERALKSTASAISRRTSGMCGHRLRESSGNEAREKGSGKVTRGASTSRSKNAKR